MTTPQKSMPKVHPFIERGAAPLRRHGIDTRGMLSLSTMFVSMAALSVSMLGAGKLITDIFNDGLSTALDGILVKITVLGLSFLFGWIVGLVSIRSFGNLVYPSVIKLYAWACLIAVS